jgi:dihydrofolate reductase
MMSVSVDGFVAGPHGHAGALGEPDALKRWKLERARQAGTHIMGRVTYEEMATHWPTSRDEYAAPMNDLPKVVFSTTLDRASWAQSSIARGELAAELTALRQRPGGDILAWGGARFAQALSRGGLVDEYVLVIHPVVFGRGLPMFPQLSGALRLRLTKAQAFDGGTVLHVYEPARD